MSRLLLISLLHAALTLGSRSPAVAEPGPGFRIVVNSASSAVKVDKRFLSEVFLRKRTRWDDDRAIQPVDLGQKSSARGAFSRDVLGRDVASVRRYWAQLVFSGRGVPPPELPNDDAVVKYVAAHDGAIGYVAAGTALTGVKAVEIE